MSRLFVWLQYSLPHHALSRLVGRLADCRWAPLKNVLIRLFVWRYRVAMDEAREPSPGAYPSFNAFFTRSLKTDARPLSLDPDALLCPADGTLSQIGTMAATTVPQAKGRSYDLLSLLGGDPRLTRYFEGGPFATVYLSPRDYHRVHMPLTGTLKQTVYVPGRLFSVNDATTARVDQLFARNERLVCLFDTIAGPMAVVLVGALIVAGIETVWGGRVTPPRRGLEVRHYTREDEPIILTRGAELGRFCLGSTVILLFGKDRIQWPDDATPGNHVTMGSALGRLAVPTD